MIERKKHSKKQLDAALQVLKDMGIYPGEIYAYAAYLDCVIEAKENAVEEGREDPDYKLSPREQIRINCGCDLDDGRDSILMFWNDVEEVGNDVDPDGINHEYGGEQP